MSYFEKIVGDTEKLFKKFLQIYFAFVINPYKKRNSQQEFCFAMMVCN